MITMKDIIREGNPLLHENAKDVVLPLSKDDEELMISMMEYIYNSIDPELNTKYDLRPAVGLAAPQLGILKKMIAIVAPDESGVEHEFALINPRLLSYSDELTYLESYFYDLGTKELVKKTMKLKGYLAVVFQHEYDHLNGILFVDKINKTDPYFVPDNSTPVVFKNDK